MTAWPREQRHRTSAWPCGLTSSRCATASSTRSSPIPLSSWVYPDETQRRRLSCRVVRDDTARRACDAATPTLPRQNRAAAVWAPPSVPQMFEWEREGVAIAEMLKRHLGRRTQFVSSRWRSDRERAHPRTFLTSIWRCSARCRRCRARVSAVLCSTTCWPDATRGWPAYLETSLERNVRFYEGAAVRGHGRHSPPRRALGLVHVARARCNRVALGAPTGGSPRPRRAAGRRRRRGSRRTPAGPALAQKVPALVERGFE